MVRQALGGHLGGWHVELKSTWLTGFDSEKVSVVKTRWKEAIRFFAISGLGRTGMDSVDLEYH